MTCLEVRGHGLMEENAVSGRLPGPPRRRPDRRCAQHNSQIRRSLARAKDSSRLSESPRSQPRCGPVPHLSVAEKGPAVAANHRRDGWILIFRGVGTARKTSCKDLYGGAAVRAFPRDYCLKIEAEKKSIRCLRDEPKNRIFSVHRKRPHHTAPLR